MKQNVGSTDRAVRMVAGIAIIAGRDRCHPVAHRCAGLVPGLRPVWNLELQDELDQRLR